MIPSRITQDLPNNQCIFIRGYRVFPFPGKRSKLKVTPVPEPELPESTNVRDDTKVSTPGDPLSYV
jgi:hypothetical protein